MFAFEKPGHTVNPRANDDESTEVKWVPLNAIGNYTLISAMQRDWPQFVERLKKISAEMAERDRKAAAAANASAAKGAR